MSLPTNTSGMVVNNKLTWRNHVGELIKTVNVRLHTAAGKWYISRFSPLFWDRPMICFIRLPFLESGDLVSSAEVRMLIKAERDRIDSVIQKGVEEGVT